VAIAALLLWLFTAAVGSYLLLTGIRAANAKPPAQERVPVVTEPPAAAGQAAASAQVPAAQPATPAAPRGRDRFDPPSLQRAKSEPLPGLRDLAEFAHPALAITGFAFWLCYVLSRDRLFAMIGFGILLGAICAGLSWFAVNNRAARRAAGAAGPAKPGAAPLAFAPRLIALHAAGAVLTVLFATLIAARA
jgi:hypothetical protein